MHCLPSQPVRQSQLLCAGAHYQPWALPEVPHKAWHRKAITPLPLSDLAADSYVSTSAADFVPKRSSYVRPTGGILRPVVAAERLQHAHKAGPCGKVLSAARCT